MSDIATYNFEIVQGDSFSTVFTIKNSDGTAIDLTNYSAMFQLRDFIGSTVKTVTPSNGITITALEGKIALTISAADSALLPVGKLSYQLQITTVSTVRTLIGGNFNVIKDLCRT